MTPFPVPQSGRLPAPAPLGEGWEGGLMTEIYNFVLVQIVNLSQKQYF
jgi:hypothetical protein